MLPKKIRSINNFLKKKATTSKQCGAGDWHHGNHGSDGVLKNKIKEGPI